MRKLHYSYTFVITSVYDSLTNVTYSTSCRPTCTMYVGLP